MQVEYNLTGKALEVALAEQLRQKLGTDYALAIVLWRRGLFRPRILLGKTELGSHVTDYFTVTACTGLGASKLKKG